MSNLKKPTKQTFPKAFTPQELFADGSLGFAFDFRDPSLMFQDVGGVTPAEYGMPVGLVLDQSQGLRLSEELCHNGDFTKGEDVLEGWTSKAGTALEWVQGGGAKLSFDSITDASMNYVMNLTAGWVLVEGEVTCEYYGATHINMNFVHGGSGDLSINIGETKVFRFMANIPFAGLHGLTIRTARGIATGYLTVRRVSVKSLPGNHAYQLTTTKRPILARSPRHGQIRNLIPNSESATTGWAGIGTTCLVEKHDDGIMRNALKFTHLVPATNARISTSTAYVYPYPRENTNNVTSFYCKRGNCRYLGFSFILGGGVFDFDTMSWARQYNGTVEDVGGGWYLFTFYTSAVAAISSGFQVGFSNTKGTYITSEPGDYGYIAYPQCEQIPSDLPPVRSNYQKTNGKYDVTEQGVPDDTYLLFDGVDDALQTGEIKFGDANATELSVWTGVTTTHLPSDTLTRAIVGTGSNGSSSGVCLYAVSRTGSRYYELSPSGWSNPTAFSEDVKYQSPRVDTIKAELSQTGKTKLEVSKDILSEGVIAPLSIGNDILRIGCRDASSIYFKGQLHTLTLVSKLVDEKTNNTVEQYTNNRTGAY